MMTLMYILGWSHLAVSLLVIALALPLVLQRVEPNRFYGVRLKESMQSPQCWYRINYAAGWYLIFWATILLVIALVMLVLRPRLSHDMTLALGLAPLLLCIAAWQTRQYARKAVQENRENVTPAASQVSHSSDDPEQ
jgi:ABC-type Fe3+ transport system permease subunit